MSAFSLIPSPPCLLIVSQAQHLGCLGWGRNPTKLPPVRTNSNFMEIKFLIQMQHPVVQVTGCVRQSLSILIYVLNVYRFFRFSDAIFALPTIDLINRIEKVKSQIFILKPNLKRELLFLK